MLTTLQQAILRKIARSELTPLNGGKPQSASDVVTWADCVIEDAQDRGVVRSLVNAGLVRHEHHGRDSVISFTDAGFAAYKELAVSHA